MPLIVAILLLPTFVETQKWKELKIKAKNTVVTKEKENRNT